MDKADIVARIEDQSDDNPNLRAVYRTGSDDERDYYLVVATKHHQGREMLKVRYFAADHDTPHADTWMKNGITARSSDALIAKLANAFAAMSNGLPDDADPMLHDISDSFAEE